MKTIAICWPRFGPYHVARIRAFAKTNHGRYRILGIETNAADNTYGWQDVPPAACDSWTWVRLENGSSLSSKLNELDPDVLCINGWGFSESLRLHFWALHRRRGVVLFSDSRKSDRKRRWLLELVKRSVLRRCGAALVAGADHGDYLVDLGMSRKRIFDGLDVVDNDYFASEVARIRDCRQDSVGTPSPHFLFVGRLVPKKHVNGLLEAFATYIAHRHLSGKAPWHLRIVGSGPLEAAILREISDLGLQRFVRLEPFQQYHELPATYAAAKCLVVPSLYSEQWGLVVNEAMASGIPVIASDACGCVASLLRPGVNGLVFSAGDADSLAQCLLSIHDLPEGERRLWGEAAQSLIASWGLDRFAKHLSLAIESALSAYGK